MTSSSGSSRYGSSSSSSGITSSRMVSTACDRDDSTFSTVAAVARLACAVRNAALASSHDETWISRAPWTRNIPSCPVRSLSTSRVGGRPFLASGSGARRSYSRSQ